MSTLAAHRQDTIQCLQWRGRKVTDTDTAPRFLRIGSEVHPRARLCPGVREDGKRVFGMRRWEMGIHLEAGRDVVSRASY